MSTDRAAVDAKVRREGALLGRVIDLLDSRAAINEWPDEAVEALGEAIAPSSGDPREREKARRLTRHLFVDMSPPVLSGSKGASRDAERLRADLADLTTFGAGLHLTKPGT